MAGYGGGSRNTFIPAIACHSGPTGGHYGANYTAKKILNPIKSSLNGAEKTTVVTAVTTADAIGQMVNTTMQFYATRNYLKVLKYIWEKILFKLEGEAFEPEGRKSMLFLIDRWAIPDAMVWRHPDAAIDDPRPTACSFSMADVHRLSAHVIKLRDMPVGVLVLSWLSHVWKSHVYDLVLWGADGNDMGVMGIYDFLCLPEWTGAEVQEEPHLNVSSKILAKVEASQKLKASTSGAILSHVAKRTRSAQAQSSGSTTRLSLFVGDSDDESDGDDDACVEIPLVTPLCSVAVIPSSGNQGRSSNAPAAEGPNTRDSWGKAIMADDAPTPSVGVSPPKPSSSLISSFRDVSGDAIHADFFPFSAGPYYATYPQDGVAGNYEFTREEWDASYRSTFRILTKEVFKDPAVCKIVVDQFPTPSEMVRVEALSEDQLTTKMSVVHCNAPLF
ncbi:hypothetical protein Tco_0715498 [Tanacetum coccineum]